MTKPLAFLSATLLLLFFPIYTQEQEIHRSGQERCIDEESAIVLANFANMVGSFINIVQDPNNRQNVGYNLGNIVHGIGNILTSAVTRTEQVTQYINSEQFKNDVKAIAISKAYIMKNQSTDL